MIVEKYTNESVFGNKPEDIEGHEDAIASDELYVPHHVLEFKYTVDELVAMNRYWQVDASELIWMSQSVHNNNSTLHKGVRLKNEAMKNRTISEETRNKMSESHKGRTPWNKCTTPSRETRNKMSESHKGMCHSEETRKKMSESRKGKKRGPYKTKMKLSVVCKMT